MFEAPRPGLDCRGRFLDLSQPRIVGILNLTPDSFSDGGRYLDPRAALARAREMLAEGAAVIDVGGESTRPGATPVSVDEEIRRVVPVIERLAAELPVPIAIDSRKAQVMRAALAAGAGMVNDVQALRDPGALEVVAEAGVPVVLMHMQGEPSTMQQDPVYEDVVEEVCRFLAERILACEFAGIPKSRLVVDPGFGFGKTLAHNLALLRDLGQMQRLGCPILVGLSRKRMFGEICGIDEPAERAAASLTGALLAVQRGAVLVRTHDVAMTRQALDVLAAVGPVPAQRPTTQPKLAWPDED